MSVKEEAVALIKTIEKLPYERLKPSVSFKESQYERFRKLINAPHKYDIKYRKPSVKEVMFRKKFIPHDVDEKFNAAQLQSYNKSLENLVGNKFMNYYDVPTLYAPKGNPDYYNRLMREIRGENKEGFWTVFKTVVFGKA